MVKMREGLGLENQVDSTALQPLYERLGQELGLEAMQKIWNEFKGMQVNFPAHLYNRDRVKAKVWEQFDGHNVQDLARKYGYSQKWVQQVINEDKSDGRRNLL